MLPPKINYCLIDACAVAYLERQISNPKVIGA
jgi:hypothetical protein